MKPLLFTLFALLNASAYAQFQEHIIESAPYTASSIVLADVDNDGDQDIIVSGGINNQLKWIENTDGLGDFSITRGILELGFSYAGDIAIADIDGDNDIDILVSTAEQDCGEIRTFRNTDGQGTFELFSVSMFTCGLQSQIEVGNINGDNYVDWASSMSASEYNDARVSWFENDGNGNVTERIIEDSYVRSFQLVDVDGDNDIDIVGLSLNSPVSPQIIWYENTSGAGNFVKHLIKVNSDLNYYSKLIAADVDSDGAMDIITAYNKTLSWYKNDGQGNFTDEIIINDDASFTKLNIFAVDIDSNGTMDILSTGDSNSITQYKNDGQQNFTTTAIIENLYRLYSPIYAKDVNGNNKIDIISNSSENGKIAWYENQMDLSVNQNSILDFSIYPNPVSEELIIKRPTREPATGNLYDTTGKLILSFTLNDQDSRINVENLAAGVYFLEISGNSNTVVKKIVIE